MNLALTLPQSPKQSVGAAVLSRLKILLSATTDRGQVSTPALRPYSFLSECECPHDCLRDHENE